jgi:Dihydrouridine synthase (Dus)
MQRNVSRQALARMRRCFAAALTHPAGSAGSAGTSIQRNHASVAWASEQPAATLRVGGCAPAAPQGAPQLHGPLFSVAPMMDYTDVHFRHLCRLLTRHATLWTEMVRTIRSGLPSPPCPSMDPCSHTPCRL